MSEPYNNYSISTDKEKLQIAVIYQYLSEESYWAKHIPLAIVEQSIKNSLCFGIYLKDEQIGFARVITDCTTFAYLADVFILEAHRGKGLSKQLMEFIMAYPQLQSLRRFCLATRDAHGLYKQFGFTPLAKPENFMEIKHDNFYTPKN
ncbi:MAG TPA: GNAT family N-acetyltransferase [Bacteroidia bacterium]|nr:GNAT family N-acetyltransferase [Bacteroidia bacterium]